MAQPAKRKRVSPNGSDILSKMRRKATTETRRRASHREDYDREFGTGKEEADTVPIESSQRSMMMVLREMITEKSPLLVITSAEAVAETDYEGVFTRNPQSRATLLPEPRVRLWPHQEEAVHFIGNREADTANTGCRGLMLCDDMGLGKTLDTLMYIYRYAQQRQRQTGRRFNGVSLIVIPCILFDTWVSEIERSFPPNSLHYVKMMGDNKTVPDLNTIENCTDIVFTTYTIVTLVHKALYGGNNVPAVNDAANDVIGSEDAEFIKHRYQSLFRIKFLRVVPDEAHFIANPASERFRAMKRLSANSYWFNTGTPIQNSYKNIYASFDFIRLPLTGVLTTIAPTVCGNSIRVSTEDKLYIKSLLEKVMIRRLKHQIIDSFDRPFIPLGVDRQIVSIDFRTRAERILYLLYANHGRSRMASSKGTGKKRTVTPSYEGERNVNITSTIQLMRQACLGFHIMRSPILPNGMLLGYNATTMKAKTTSFGEKLLYEDSCHYEHIERDNAELEYAAFKHNQGTLYEYQSNGIDEARIFEWSPYDIQPCPPLLYKQCYDIMSSAVFDGTLTTLKSRVTELYGGTGDENQIGVIYENLVMRMLPRYSTKQLAFIEYIQQIEDPTDKVVICSDSVVFLRSMAVCLSDHAISSCIVVGDIHKFDIANQIAIFRRDPSIKVLLLSLKKGCVGLNIPEANHILFPGPWWNPQSDIQAECRLQRFGQQKKVHIRQFVIIDSMEEYMLSLSMYKKTIADDLIESPVDTSDDTLEVINAVMDETSRTRLFDYTLNVEHLD